MKTIYRLLPALLAIAFMAAPAAAQDGARRNNSISARQENKAERKQMKVDKVQSPTNISHQPATDNRLRQFPDTQGSRRNGSESRSGSNRPPAGGHGGYIPGYNNAYPGNRPPLPHVRKYNRTQVYERTNAAEIVVNTLFTSKMEAYYYIARLLDERYYTVNSYGNNYNWIRSDVSFIPTPFDWTNPMTHNQFQMYFKISGNYGRIRVIITAQWRESVLSNRFSVLRFQPSSSYSTYYAWNVLEDIADNIPNTGIIYRTSDLF